MRVWQLFLCVGPMKIATWNVNSISARFERFSEWIAETSPDVVLLQEIKCVAEKFPQEAIEDMGYNVLVHGQKTYNGVAILSKFPLEDPIYNLPGDPDPQSRYLEAFTKDLRVVSLYVPNGEAPGTEKYTYKMQFFDRLRDHVKKLMMHPEKLVIGGDYNVAPTDADVYSPETWHEKILVSTPERNHFHSLLGAGLVDAVRQLHPEESARNEDWYTWWDYRQGAFHRNWGLRIDHLLLSPQASQVLESVGIDRNYRKGLKPSDHVPLWCVLK